MPAVLRIIDANANRAREALRVMEEAARFLLNDAELAEPLKKLRHQLAQSLADIPGLEAHRDTPGDVGTSISTHAERERADAAAVARAAGKRLSEALRAIEEYAKTLPATGLGLAMAAEQMRYQGYDLEKRLNTALGSGRRKQWRLCVLVSESLCKLPWLDVVDLALHAGADCIQLREKHMDAGPLLDRALALVDHCSRAGAAAIINDRPDVAYLAGADGVHLGQTDLPLEEARRIVGHQLLIGVSTTNLTQAQTAIRHGADYLGLGPMFHTTTKDKPNIAGPHYLREYLALNPDHPTPHLAIGGINPANLHHLTDLGCQGIAVSAAVCQSENPAEIVTDLLKQLPDTSTAICCDSNEV